MQQLTSPFPQYREPAPASDFIFVLPDGRKLGYRVFGDPSGRPVLALHGTPGSRFKYAGSHEAALAAGLQLIAIDRWGYGLTSPPGGASRQRRNKSSLLDFGADVTALADHLGFPVLAITGVSGGCPFAVACAAALGARVSALALVSPVGLIADAAPGRRWRAFHSFCFRVLPRIPGSIGLVFHLYRAGLAAAPNLAMSVAISRSASADRRAMRDEATRKRLIETFAAGLQPGVAGPKIDMALFSRPWGIDLAGLTVKTRIWIGLADRNVPLPAVDALAAALSNCELTQLPGAGHLWVAQNADQVMSWISEATAQLECATPRKPACVDEVSG